MFKKRLLIVGGKGVIHRGLGTVVKGEALLEDDCLYGGEAVMILIRGRLFQNYKEIETSCKGAVLIEYDFPACDAPFVLRYPE